MVYCCFVHLTMKIEWEYTTHTLDTCAHTHTHKKNALINNHWLLFPDVLNLSSPSLCIAPLVHIVSVPRPNEKRKKASIQPHVAPTTPSFALRYCPFEPKNRTCTHTEHGTRNTETPSNAPPLSRRGEPPRPPAPRAQYLAFLPAASSIAASLLLNAVAPLRSSVERWRRKRQ